LALLLVGTISYRAVIASSESVQWVVHTYEVQTNLSKLLAAAEGIESSYRGFAFDLPRYF
jgi:CHASE3 domain sensor protein